MIKRIRPARDYQRPDDPARMLMLGAKTYVRRDLREAFAHLGDLVPGPVERLVASGRWREIVGEINFDHYREILKKPFARLGKAYEAAAQLGVRKINGSFHQARRRVHFIAKAIDVFNFDMFDRATQEELRNMQDSLIVGLLQDARDAIETIVLDGARNGLSAAAIVDDIRDMIGLTDTQAQAVLNFRSMLQSLDRDALTRQLRNTAFDAEILSAIRNDTALADVQIARMVSDYESNYLDYRAATIAQTESVRAVNAGLHGAYQQAIDRGALPSDAVRREWRLGDMPCPVCESIPDMNPGGVDVGEAFTSIEGEVSDPPVHPNCMCHVDYITDISKVPEYDEESGSYDTAALQAAEYGP